MSSNANNDNVYMFRNPKFEIGSTKWCMSSITMKLADNSVPTVNVVVDPIHEPHEQVAPATKTTLESMAKWNLRLQQFAINKEKATLYLEVHRPSGIDQVLELTDWVVTNTGVISDGSQFAFEVEIQHPVVESALNGMNLPSIVNSETPFLSAVTGSDVLTAIESAITIYSKSLVNRELAKLRRCSSDFDAAAMIKEFKTRLKASVDKLIANVQWNPQFYPGCQYGDFPIVRKFAMFNKYFPRLVFNEIYGLCSTDLLNVLLHSIADSWFITLVPTYWDKLTLTPTTPWANPQIIFEQEDISSPDFPAMERNSLAGIFLALPNGVDGFDYTSMAAVAQNNSALTSGLIYTPKAKPKGIFISANIPEWLSSLKNLDTGPAGQVTEYSAAEKNRGVVTSSNIQHGEKLKNEDKRLYGTNKDAYLCAMYYCAHQIFLTQFRQSSQASISGKLMLQYAGSQLPVHALGKLGYVIPGVVARLKADTDVVMDFYITQVLHTIDVAAGTARTEIGGSYVRPNTGYPNIAVNGTCNPVYS